MVQGDPIRPTLKAPGTKRLRLKSDEPLSNFAFKFELRRYTKLGFIVFLMSFIGYMQIQARGY